ncbi:DUF192 domain-containing protein [Polycladidibacter hongkongensis]|uniref:DUF192 domain-containing protein n=1 Tax=Polycladidibacter hongkongensis TaxID=1647556 RepID=UPI00155EC7B1|nr:DUF192 domain-containing protein [Pseudovibrio hongkongensis]
MSRLLLVLLGLCAVLATLGPLQAQTKPNMHNDGVKQSKKMAVVAVRISGSNNKVHHFSAEVAKSPSERARGLMYRQQLAPNAGMLFVFEDAGPQTFWMKNTYLPLDLLFIDAQRRVHHIAANAVPFSEKIISSRGDVVAVLEINGGLAKKLGIRVGDRVDWGADNERPGL